MAKKKEVTVEEKLRALYDLQLIDSRIDEIKNMRGELPLEVKDLEDEIAGLQTRLNNFSTDIENLETAIANKRNNIEEAKALSKKYQEQQKNVRNNREFDSSPKRSNTRTWKFNLPKSTYVSLRPRSLRRTKSSMPPRRK